MGQVEHGEPSAGSASWVVTHARTVIEATVHGRSAPEPPDVDPPLDRDRGAFVTLRKSGRLRGCMGRPMPTQSAVAAVRTAAVEAATDDPRFPPLTAAELDAVTVEVSLLTPPRTIEDVDPASVTVGRDGLLVRRGDRSGLLLPQVPVERGWDAERFLAETCRKAGLAETAWREPKTAVSRFEASIFAESEPEGPVERVDWDLEVTP